MAVLVGAAVAYGALKGQVKTSAREITELQKSWSALIGNPGDEPAYIKRGECDQRTLVIGEQIEHIKKKIDRQGKATKSLENFARYMLIRKEGLSIVEVEDILNGD